MVDREWVQGQKHTIMHSCDGFACNKCNSNNTKAILMRTCNESYVFNTYLLKCFDCGEEFWIRERQDDMTGKELIEYIQKRGLEDHVIAIQYGDSGGYYYGTNEDIEPLIVKANKRCLFDDTKDYDRLIL